MLLNKNLYWFFFDYKGEIPHLKIHMNSQVFFLDNSDSFSFKISEIYAFNHGPNKKQMIGYWKENEGFNIFDENVLSRRIDLNGATVRTGLINNIQFHMYLRNVDLKVFI